MAKLTNDEKEKLLNKALILCKNANYLLEKCYEAHCKEVKNRKK